VRKKFAELNAHFGERETERDDGDSRLHPSQKRALVGEIFRR